MYKRDLSLANAVRYINNYESQRLEILRREEEKNVILKSRESAVRNVSGSSGTADQRRDAPGDGR